MIPYYILSGITLFGLFVLFLVLSKTLNGIINQFLKMEYMLQKEYEYKREEKEIRRMIEENIRKEVRDTEKGDEG